MRVKAAKAGPTAGGPHAYKDEGEERFHAGGIGDRRRDYRYSGWRDCVTTGWLAGNSRFKARMRLNSSFRQRFLAGILRRQNLRAATKTIVYECEGIYCRLFLRNHTEPIEQAKKL
jgi:hypothetical protein